MGNKNNNLEDFLRKKFSDIENSEEAWTKPSLGVKNDILDKITEPAPKKRKKALLFFLLFLGIGIAVCLFKGFKGAKSAELATFYTKKITKDAGVLKGESVDNRLNSSTENLANDPAEKSANDPVGNTVVAPEFSKDELLERNALLRTVIQNQNDVIAQLKKETVRTQKNTAEKNLNKEASLGDASKEAFQNLLEANNQLKIEQKKLKFLNKNQGGKIEQLNAEKQLLLDRLNGESYASNSKGEDASINNKIAFEGIEPLIKTALEEEETVIERVILEEGFALDKPKRKVEFEVGYQLGIRGRMTEVIEYVERQGAVTNQVKDKLLVSHVHGLNIGVSPVKNFWIKTGAHVGNMNLHQKHRVKFIYNSNRASTVTAGAYADDINDLSNTGINTLQESITLLANTQGTVDGDELDLNFQTNLILTSLQIPLEFNYLYGKKKFQALFQLGGQWNLLNYQYHMNGFETKINNQGTYDLANENAEPEASSVEYWGVHAGVGLSYKMSKHLTFQGLLSYEYYFQYNTLNKDPNGGLNIALQAISHKAANPISNMGFGLKLGLNYRF